MNEVLSKSYTLTTETGAWLGQVVLTNDGMFASVTDWGNFSYSWRAFGKEDFRKFICDLNIGYFSTKLATGLSYVIHGKKIDRACDTFAEKVLPTLQEVLRKELEQNIGWN